MKPVLCSLLVLTACGHAAPKAQPAPSPRPTPVLAADAGPAPAPAIDPGTATVPPAPPAAPDAGTIASAPTNEGCKYTDAPGKKSGPEASIIGLPGGESGYDSPAICAAQACTGGLTIELPNQGGWKAGVYDIEVGTERGAKTCHVTLKAAGPWKRPAKCANEPELSAECAPHEGPNLGPIMLTAGAKMVHVKIVRDGKTLADETLHPKYNAKRWDGFDCAPECANAQASVKVR
jgi:hypothetical protein